MKKNRTMRVAALLLALTLMTSCFVGGTFAKYTTAGTGTDSARVAHWGVTVTHDNNIFYNAYKDTWTTYTASENVDTITVQASTDNEDVVAPGTEGSLAAFDIGGTPEVDVAVTYTADLVLTNWFIDKDKDGIKNNTDYDYCPIIFNVNGTNYFIDGTIIKNVAELEAAVEAAIVAAKATYHTNDDLSAVEDDLVVTWKWNYDDGVGLRTDAKDTAMGDQAASTGVYDDCVAAVITLTVTCTITQIN